MLDNSSSLAINLTHHRQISSFTFIFQKGPDGNRLLICQGGGISQV